MELATLATPERAFVDDLAGRAGQSAEEVLARLQTGRNKYNPGSQFEDGRLTRLVLHGDWGDGILDLGELDQVTNVEITGTDLAEVRLPLSVRRAKLRGNQLSRLDLRDNAALNLLWADQNQLETLLLPKDGVLCSLVVKGNSLRELDLTAQRQLQYLRVDHNQLKTLDLRGCPVLGEVDFDGNKGVEIEATDHQKDVCATLRRQFKRGTRKRSPLTINRYELHDWARDMSWDMEEWRLSEVVCREDCDLATALMIYWLGKPHYFRQYEDYGDLHRQTRMGRENFLILEVIEKRVAKGDYEAKIFFDPRNDRGTDWTTLTYDDQPKVRDLPRRMFEPSLPVDGLARGEAPEGVLL